MIHPRFLEQRQTMIIFAVDTKMLLNFVVPYKIMKSLLKHQTTKTMHANLIRSHNVSSCSSPSNYDQRPISQRVCNYKLFCLQSQTIFTIFVKSDFTKLCLLSHFQQKIFVKKFVNCKNKGTFSARYLQIANHCKIHVDVQASNKTCWILCANWKYRDNRAT